MKTTKKQKFVGYKILVDPETGETYPMQMNVKEISDTLRGPKVNARRHWDGENWILEDAKTRKPLLIGTRAQILDEYDRINKTP